MSTILDKPGGPEEQLHWIDTLLAEFLKTSVEEQLHWIDTLTPKQAAFILNRYAQALKESDPAHDAEALRVWIAFLNTADPTHYQEEAQNGDERDVLDAVYAASKRGGLDASREFIASLDELGTVELDNCAEDAWSDRLDSTGEEP